MAYSNRFRSVLNDNFKILTWVLILFIAITPNFIFMQSARAASVGGWNLSNPVAKGASIVYDATKNVVINGKDFVKDSWVKITPNATQVAKVLRGGVAGVALSIAVEQLIGADYSWWLEGDSVKYQVPVPPEAYPKCYSNPSIGCFGSSALAASAALIYDNTLYPTYKSTKTTQKVSSNTLTVTLYDKDSLITNIYTFSYVVNPAYDPDANKDEQIKSIPLVTVAEKVISNAESGDENAKVATTAAAADIVAEAETDNTKARPIVSQAEANATTKLADAAEAEKANEATGTSQPNTANPEATDIALEFPVFCNWAPTVCEAAQTVISFPQTLTNWWETGKSKAEQWATAISDAWTYAKNWATENHTDTESTKVTVEQDNSLIFDDSQRISFSNSCPTPQQFSVSFSGTTQNLEFSYDPLCQFMSMIKPFVVAGSYLIGAYIVMGLSRGSAE